MAIDSDPVFLGLTRSTTIQPAGLPIGVSYEALIACVVLTYLPFTVAQSPLCLGLFVPLYALAWAVEKHDPRAFRLVLLWLRTKGAARTRRFWRASSRDPFSPRRY